MNRERWNERYSGTELVWGGEPNQFLVTETADLTPGTALDVACGDGRNAVWLAGQGWRVTALDFSAVALNRARQHAERHAPSVEWRGTDITSWEPEPDCADLVLLAYVHLPAPERRALHRRAAGALRPGGRLLVIAHDATNRHHGVGGPQEPEVLCSPDDVLVDVVGLGLRVERCARVTRTVETSEGPREAIDALVRLARPIIVGHSHH